MKTKLIPTQNSLREPIRRAMIDLLNQQLADVLDLVLQAKQAHWNVKGPHFIGLHELFDKVAEELEEFTDDIAESAIELGGVALGTVQIVAKQSRLGAYPLNISSGRLLFENQEALEDEGLTQYASTLGLDAKRLTGEVLSGAHVARVREDFRTGARAGVNGTPAIFINGAPYEGEVEVDAILAALPRI
jgi:DNA-binding ferritin-like protein